MKRQKAIEETTAMLEGYQDLQRQIKGLRFDMQHPNTVSDQEVISQMSMPGISDYVGGAADGRISDKTMYIALNYGERACRLNEEESLRVTESLFLLERKAERLKFYVGLLPPHLARSLCSHYFEGRMWKEVADIERVSVKAMLKWRAKAISMLAQLLFHVEEED